MAAGSWWLTVHLWRGSGWRQRARLVLIGLGVAVAVAAALIGTLGPRVQQAQADVIADRTPVAGDRVPGRPLVQVSESTLGLKGHRYHQYLVYADSATEGPLPDGLTAWPQVGHSIVSSSLQKASDFPMRSSLGTIDTTLLPRSLTASPSEYVSYTRVAAPLGATTGPDATATTGFGRSSVARSSALWVLVEMGLLIVLPALVMMTVMFRLAATANHARTLGLFRAGMDPQSVARLAANDAVLPVSAGYLIGLVLVRLLAPTVELHGWLGMSWWPEQAALAWPVHIVVFALLLAVARMVCLRAARNVIRQSDTRRRRAGVGSLGAALNWAAFIVFTAVVGFLAVLVWRMSHVTVNTVDASGRLEVIVLAAIVVGVVCIIGLARGGTRRCARTVGRRESLPLFLGGRAARHHLPETASLAAFVAIIVTLFGAVTGFLGVVSFLVEGNTDRSPFMVHYANVSAERREPLATFVSAHHGVAEANITVDGHPIVVGVGSCADLRAVAAARAEMNMGACASQVSRGAYTEWKSSTITLPGLDTMRLPDRRVEGAPWDVILPSTPRNLSWATSQDDGEAVFVASRNNGAFDQLLAEVQDAVRPSYIDADVKNPDALDAYVQQRALVRAGLAVGLVLMLLAFVMTCIELRWRARPTTSMLAATGVPQRAMRIASAVQFVLPVLAAGIPAGLLGTLAGLGFMAIGSAPTEIFSAAPWTPTVLAFSVCAAVTAVAGYLFGGGSFSADARTDT